MIPSASRNQAIGLNQFCEVGISVWRPDLSDAGVRSELRPRVAPYFQLLQYGRHLGLKKRDAGTSLWTARVRLKDGRYRHRDLGYATLKGDEICRYEEAVKRANSWFQTPDVMSEASEAYPLGGYNKLKICPIGDVYTVGHALEVYLEWKSIAATRSNYESLVSVVNHHLVERISNIPLEEFNGTHFHKLAIDVLETPPKRGRAKPGPRRKISDLSEEELRKRKKTLNRLVSILRIAFELSWERDLIQSDRPMRCLRRLPNWDRPRVVFLDRNECRRLLDAAHEDLKPLILAALYTGCRARELTGMRVGDLSHQTRSVFIAAPKHRRPRHVFLPEEGYEFFVKLVGDRGASEKMFIKRNGRSWGGEYKEYFLAARHKAGLPRIVSFHGLRHTYASQLVQAGASLIVVADQLGHASTQTVSKFYGHLASPHRALELNRRFEPIFKKRKRKRQAVFRHSEPTPPDEFGSVPRWLLEEHTSWPRSNHSKLSGPLLEEIRRRH